MTAIIKKTYRVDEETDIKIKELLRVYDLKTENELIKKIVSDVYELKKSKSLVPIEELSDRDRKLEQAIFELGKLKGSIEEKEKVIEKLEKDRDKLMDILERELEKREQLEKELKKSFWARLFGR